jgi:hypothetical protein
MAATKPSARSSASPPSSAPTVRAARTRLRARAYRKHACAHANNPRRCAFFAPRRRRASRRAAAARRAGATPARLAARLPRFTTHAYASSRRFCAARPPLPSAKTRTHAFPSPPPNPPLSPALTPLLPSLCAQGAASRT